MEKYIWKNILRKQSVQNTLTGEKRMIGGQLLRARSRLTHGPDLQQRVLWLDAFELSLEHHVFELIVSRLGDICDGAARLWIKHDLVLNERVLVHNTENVTASDVTAHLVVQRVKIPGFAAIQCFAVNTTRDVNTLEKLRDVFQGTLNTVKDAIHDARTKLNRERLACLKYRIANG